MKKLFQQQVRVLMILIMAFIVSCKDTKSNKADTAEDIKIEAVSDFQISLAQWSLHKAYFGEAVSDYKEFTRMLKVSPDSVLQGELDPLDFPKVAAGYGIYSIELVNTMYFSKANDEAYWTEFKKKCEEAGVTVGLIMCDGLGNLGEADPEKRMKVVESHYPWVDIAKFLGAHSIRVNTTGEGIVFDAKGEGTPEKVAANTVDGLTKLGAYGASKGINIIAENHGGFSSDGNWLSGVMTDVGMENVGTLPDFGNFCIEYGPERKYCAKAYNRYKGITELMPFAKAVSAKSNDFDDQGNEIHSDYLKIMRIVKEFGYKGDIGIEYEGTTLSEDEGIKATKALLEKVFKELH
ncbi:MAG: TIM barrel protein [Bacteroidota bacterium]